MKRKIFSKLLMGAFLIASISSFVSCKDYDDDIKRNTDAITALQTTVNNLQTALDAAKAEANTAHATFALKTQVAADIAAATKGLATEEAMAQADKANADAIAALQDLVKTLATADALEAAKKEAADALAKAMEGTATKEDLDKVSVAVSAIDSKLDGIKTALDETNNNVKANADAIAAATKNIEAQQAAIVALQEALKGTASAADKTELANAIAALRSDVTASSTNLGKLSSDLNALSTALNGKADANALKALENKVTELEAVKKDLEDLKKTAEQIKTLDELKKTMEKANTAIDKIAPQVNLLTVFVTKHLNSLVFTEAYMWNGIESTVVPAIQLAPRYGLKPDAKGNTNALTSAEVWDAYDKNGKFISASGAAAKTYTIDGYGSVRYDYNPRTADLTKYTYSFLTNDPIDLTRASSFAVAPVSATVDGTNTYVDGEGRLNVRFKGNMDALKLVFGNQTADKKAKPYQLPMIALNAAVGDTAVSSDWALVLPTVYKDLVLADNLKNWTAKGHNTLSKGSHLYKTAGDAIKDVANPTHEVDYQSSIDLKKFVVTDATMVYTAGADVATGSQKCATLSADVVKALGLSYNFDLVEYETTAGKSDTKQSMHAKIVNGVLTPKKIEKSGDDYITTDQTATRAAVGKVPLVRVTLTDASGNVYAYGYLTVKIIENAKAPIDKYGFAFAGVKYANCNKINFKVTWEEIETQVYNDMNVTKTEFYNNYLAADAGKTLDQYVKTANGFMTVKDYNDAVAKTAKDKYTKPADQNKYIAENSIPVIGKISITNDNVASATDLIDWDIETAVQGSLTTGNFKNTTLAATYNNANATNPVAEFTTEFVDKTNGHIKEVVRYIKLTDKGQMTGDLFVKMTINEGAIQFAQGNVGKRLVTPWYATESQNLGYDELHATIVTPDLFKPTNTAQAFKYSIVAGGYVGSKIQIENINTDKNHFSTFATYGNANAQFYFTAPSSATYNADTKRYEWTVKGQSGNTYLVVVSADKLSLVVDGVYDSSTKKYVQGTVNGYTVATGGTKIITLDNKNNATVPAFDAKVPSITAATLIAQDVLNYKGHKDLKYDETLTANVYVSFADAATYCYHPYLSGESFPVRFIRPLDAEPTDGATITDNLSTKKVDILSLITVYDFLGNKFNNDYPWFFEWYGVTLSIDPLEATTDAGKDSNGNNIKLSEYGGITLKGPSAAVKASEVKDAKGNVTGYKFANTEITYTRKTVATNTFHIYVPIKVSYKYGSFKVIGTITVNATSDNGSARKK